MLVRWLAARQSEPGTSSPYPWAADGAVWPLLVVAPAYAVLSALPGKCDLGRPEHLALAQGHDTILCGTDSGIENPNVDFYDTLGEGGVPTEEMELVWTIFSRS